MGDLIAKDRSKETALSLFRHAGEYGPTSLIVVFIYLTFLYITVFWVAWDASRTSSKYALVRLHRAFPFLFGHTWLSTTWELGVSLYVPWIINVSQSCGWLSRFYHNITLNIIEVINHRYQRPKLLRSLLLRYRTLAQLDLRAICFFNSRFIWEYLEICHVDDDCTIAEVAFTGSRVRTCRLGHYAFG